MKKYSILFILVALSGCSMLDGILSKEFIAEDIAGKAIPTDLDNLTLVYGRTDLRFTNGYISLKGDSYDTYAARIVKVVTSTGEFKLFISDGSRKKGELSVNALYVTNAGKNIYGIGTSNDVNINSPFPEVYTPSSMGSSEGKLYLEWVVDEMHKPTPLPLSHQGTYRSTSGGVTTYKVSATGISQVHSGQSNFEEKFLRVVSSGSGYECYTSNGAYKITATDLFSGGGMGGTPATDVTSWNTPIATKP